MPPRPRFSASQLQAAALAIADEQGIDALTMRSLAAALGTGPMTLYNYVRDRDELDSLVVEAVMSEVAWTKTRKGDWQRRVTAICEAMWLSIRAHPNVIALILTRRSLHHATLVPAEALLQALADSGRSGRELLMAFRVVFGFVVGLAQAQLAGPHPTASQGDSDPTIARVRSLSPEQFPKLVEIANAAAGIAPEEEFRAGLAIVLAGLATQARQPAPTRKGPRPVSNGQQR
jgi:AcrR family transcriptional regulator